jgi:YD repeat-containing protein
MNAMPERAFPLSHTLRSVNEAEQAKTFVPNRMEVEDFMHFKSVDIRHNELGQPIEETHKDKEGKLTDAVRYTYETLPSGKSVPVLIQSVSFIYDSPWMSTRTLSYDDQERLAGMVFEATSPPHREIYRFEYQPGQITETLETEWTDGEKDDPVDEPLVTTILLDGQGRPLSASITPDNPDIFHDESYEYDDQGRLVRETDSWGHQYEYKYDTNRVIIERIFQDNTRREEEVREYDDQGRLVKRTAVSEMDRGYTHETWTLSYDD